MPPRLTELAHEGWSDLLQKGGYLVDATAGNGYDTVFLARLAGPRGFVLAIDIQQAAIERTRDRLQMSGLADRVRLLAADHSRLGEILSAKSMPAPDFICFNLGYLPHGDHQIRTHADSTRTACEGAARVLSASGCLSLIAYRGHEGAMQETQTLIDWIASLPPHWQCLRHVETGSRERPGPVWWLLKKGDS